MQMRLRFHLAGCLIFKTRQNLNGYGFSERATKMEIELLARFWWR